MSMTRAVSAFPKILSKSLLRLDGICVSRLPLNLSRNVCHQGQLVFLSGADIGHKNADFILTQSRSLNSLARNWNPKITQSKITNIQRTPARTAKTAKKGVVESKSHQQGTVTVGEKVKQAGKDATYTGIVIVGIGVTALMFFAVARELFSGDSPNGVYTRAFKMCKKNEELIDVIGEPMKCFGELNRRGRRRHPSHTEYEVDGTKIMRMKFYVEGPFNKGTAQLEVRKTEGRYQFRYLFVTIDSYPHQTIIVEDNR